MSETRPPHFPPGTPIGEHYTVEGLVRLSEGRMFYLVNNNRADKKNRKCWECGHGDTPRTERACGQCGAPMRDRRFLVSSRWESALFESYEQYYVRQLSHPAIVAPVDVFRWAEQLLTVIPYNGEGLMVDESAPLPNLRILDIAQRIAGALAFLNLNGVVVRTLNRANLLIAPDSTIRLYDFDVVRVSDQPVLGEERGVALPSVGDMLARYCDVESKELQGYMAQVEAGQATSPSQLGRAIEQRVDSFGALSYSLLSAAISDVGLSRQLNEDNWGWRKLTDTSSLFVVADGMGGHDSGEVASAMAVATICKVAEQKYRELNPSVDKLEGLLDESFQSANNAIKAEAESKGTDMGTTMVTALVWENRVAFVANVGDSRAYLIRNQALHQVSKDHSLVAKMVERGRITAEEARHHPHSNILLRTVGTERDVDIDIFRVELQTGDRLMMCTDGLWGEVEDRDMETILNTYSDPRVASRELIRAAHHGGGKDNVTLILVTIP
jgi:serine/threonine protein phosphatase PrpC